MRYSDILLIFSCATCAIAMTIAMAVWINDLSNLFKTHSEYIILVPGQIIQRFEYRGYTGEIPEGVSFYPERYNLVVEIGLDEQNWKRIPVHDEMSYQTCQLNDRVDCLFVVSLDNQDRLLNYELERVSPHVINPEAEPGTQEVLSPTVAKLLSEILISSQ